MGVKRTQKTASASLQKKAKKVSQEDKDNELNPGEIGRRCPKKNYYESDNSCVDDSDSDSDFEKPTSQKRKHNKRKISRESDSDEDADEILTKLKVQKSKQGCVKKKASTAKKKRKSKRASSDPYRSSEESDGSRNESQFFKKYQPLLSSEGSDSDIPIENNCWKNKMANSLECKLSDKSDEIKKEPVTNVKLISKTINANKDVCEKKECSIKINCEDKDVLKEVKLEDTDEEGEGIKIEVKTEHDKLILLEDKEDSPKDEASVKKKKVSKKSAATKKSRSCSKAEKCEEDSIIKETSKRKETKKNLKSKSIKNSATKKEKKTSKIKDIDDVSAVLMQFEGKKSGNKIISESEESLEDAEDSSESDWEEVEDDPSVPSTSSGKPQQAIEITLEQEQFMKRKKKKKTGGFDWKAFFRRQINVFQRELQIKKHKVHLLCLIGHGMVLNKLCCDPVLKALALSLVPVSDKPDFTVGTIKNLLRAFATSVQIKPPEHDVAAPTYFSIVKAFSNCEATSTKEYTTMIVMSLRSLGFKVRLVLSFHPLPLKVSKEGEKKITAESKNIKKEKNVVKKTNNFKLNKVAKKEPQKVKKSKSVKNSKNKEIAEKKPNKDDDSRYWKKNRPSRKKSQNISYNETDGSDFEEDNEMAEKVKPCKKTLASKVSEKMTSSSSSVSSDDFEEKPVNVTRTKRTGLKAGHKIISSSSSDQSFTSNLGDVIETWIEVYLENEKRWLSIDCINMVFDDLSHFENLDSRPLSYIVTFDNDGYLKDVTPRYSTQWMLKTRKLRVQEEWWEKTMKPYLNQDEDNKIEDSQIQDNLLKQPLPKAISEYKNHPLYILKRHLLKFEAIYPNSAVPLGYIRNEPVYARECVHQLHARETWMKEGRNVKVGEEPYKMVKSRPKWNKPKENPDVPDLPVFGRWQTEIYVPPPAVDGKIPRNEYGNVELFKPTMLPAGTVHLKESGLNRVARKLGVDCAAAMVGWDFHGGACHPVFDGWIICVENKDMILEEWSKEQERAQLREIEKREKRVYGNWKKLIRGLLIRERLKKKYDLTEPELVDAEKEVADETHSSQPRISKNGNKKTAKSKKGEKKDDCKS